MKRFPALAALAAAALLSDVPAAAAPIYMKFDTIQGEIKDPAFPGSIEIQSYQLGDLEQRIATAHPAGARNASTVHVSSLTVSKVQDQTSPKLMEAKLTGHAFRNVTIFMRKAGGTQPYLEIKLENCMISSYQTSGHAGPGGQTPNESLTLNFTKIQYSYTPTDAKRPGAATNVVGATSLQNVGKPSPTPTPIPSRAVAPVR